MNIVIDIGNTSMKLAVFRNNRLYWLWNGKDPISAENFQGNKTEKSYSILSTVINDERQKNLIRSVSSASTLIKLSYKTPLPFKNLYKTPATLGLDRIAAI